MPLFPPRINALLKGFTDHHSHILPGVDDGVKKMDTSLKVLKHYEQLGLRSRFAELCAAYQGPIKLHLAAEYMMDALFDERLEQGDLLPLGDDGQQLLVETSYFTPPMDLDGILRRVKQKGFYPVLAHPERYVYMEKSRYAALKAEGIRFQLNLSSLAGGYGSQAKKNSLWLLKKGYDDLAGSDLHSLRNTDYWSARAPRALKQLLQS